MRGRVATQGTRGSEIGVLTLATGTVTMRLSA